MGLDVNTSVNIENGQKKKDMKCTHAILIALNLFSTAVRDLDQSFTSAGGGPPLVGPSKKALGKLLQ